MSSPARERSERIINTMNEQPQSDGQNPADTISRNPINGVAYSTMDQPLRTVVRRRSGIRDSKHTSAATLAVDLASSSTWSDNILPQVIHVRESNPSESSMGLQQVGFSLNENHPAHTPFDPPPEYSVSQDRDLLPESNNSEIGEMRHPPRPSEMAEVTHPPYNYRDADPQYGASEPLMGRSSHGVDADRRPPWLPNKDISKQRGPSFGQRLIVAIVFLLFVAGALMGFFWVCRIIVAKSNPADRS